MSSIERWSANSVVHQARVDHSRIEREKLKALHDIDVFIGTEIARLDSRIAVLQALGDLPGDLPPHLRRLAQAVAASTDSIITRL